MSSIPTIPVSMQNTQTGDVMVAEIIILKVGIIHSTSSKDISLNPIFMKDLHVATVSNLIHFFNQKKSMDIKVIVIHNYLKFNRS